MKRPPFPGVRLSVAAFVVGGVLAAPVLAGDGVKVISSIVFAQVAGEKIEADVYLPAGDGPFPGVLVIHGGAWKSGIRSHMDTICRRLAAEGYVAATVDYRLAPKHIFPAQIEDCQTALRWFYGKADEYKIDKKRIATWGYSAGAHLALLLAVRPVMGDDGKTPLPIKAVIAGGAPCEFRVTPPKSTGLAFWLGGTRAEKRQNYRDASPAAFFSESTPPVFFYNGDQDNLVDVRGVRKAHAALTRLGVDTILYEIPGGGHIDVFSDPAPKDEAIKFLNARLKP